MPDHPSQIAGGCLCGGVRYTIDFPSAASWPPDRHTCQCTQCRKWTGALMASFLDIKASQLHLPKSPPYGEYSASPSAYRGFCTVCGSTLLWRRDRGNTSPEETEIEITTGTLDQDALLGEYGSVLATAAGGHYWGENAVKGVTDGVGSGGKEKVFVRG